MSSDFLILCGRPKMACNSLPYCRGKLSALKTNVRSEKRPFNIKDEESSAL